VVVDQHARGDLRRGEGRQEVIADHHRRRRGVERHAGVVARHEERLVLQRDIVDGDAGGLYAWMYFTK
jgi:hypothetical protein